VLDNLLNNAAKYTFNRGRIALAVDCDAGEVVLRVEDSGVGIPPDVLPHVFGLFKQADATLARTSGGLGIGLTIVKGLVDMHGGRISVASTVGRGSVFEVRLPQAAPREPAVSKHHSESPPPMNILIVEDNEDAATSLALLLELGGHAVQTASDGPTALRKLEQSACDAILVDIGLPGMSGYELARAVKRGAYSEGALLVAISGYGSAEDKVKSTLAGFDAHLVKPVDFSALAALLADHGGVDSGGAAEPVALS
jgi:CheY-like chemotaxis protein